MDGRTYTKTPLDSSQIMSKFSLSCLCKHDHHVVMIEMILLPSNWNKVLCLEVFVCARNIFALSSPSLFLLVSLMQQSIFSERSNASEIGVNSRKTIEIFDRARKMCVSVHMHNSSNRKKKFFSSVSEFRCEQEIYAYALLLLPAIVFHTCIAHDETKTLIIIFVVVSRDGAGEAAALLLLETAYVHNCLCFNVFYADTIHLKQFYFEITFNQKHLKSVFQRYTL